MKEIIIDNKPIQIDSKEKILMELINGRPPANDYEKSLVVQLDAMKAKGYIPYIPSND